MRREKGKYSNEKKENIPNRKVRKKENIPIRRQKIFRLEKGKHIPNRKVRKKVQLEKGKYSN